MTGPAWLSVGFAALMLVIAAGSACRLSIGRLRGRGTEPDADALHVAMGVAMAGMFEPRLSLALAAAWRVLFVAAAAWFAWRAVRARGKSGGPWCTHPAPHAVECAAMVYMLMPAGRETTMPGMSTPGSAGNPAIALVLALFLLGYLLWTADRLAAMSRATAAAAAEGASGNQQAVLASATSNGAGTLTLTAAPPAALTGRAELAPRFAACCKIAMIIGMGYMLITML